MIERLARRFGALLLAAMLGACATAPPPAVAPPPPPPEPLQEYEAVAAATLLELEDRRQFDEAILRDLAASESPFVRARTAIALARLGDAAGRAIVRGLLTDRDTAVAATAAFAAGLLRDTGSVGVLTGLLPAGAAAFGAPSVAAEAARALGSLGTAESRAALAAFLARGDVESPPSPTVVVSALLAAANLEEFDPDPLARWVAAGDPRLRWAAAYAVARGDRPGAARVLFPLLDDPEPTVRAAALRGISAPAAAMAGIRADDVLEDVLELAADSVYAVRIEGIRALGRFSDPRAVDALLESLEDGPPHDRLAAIHALGEAGERATGSALILREIALDPREPSFVRAEAARVAVHLEPGAAPAFLTRIEADRDWRLRAAAARGRSALGESGLPALRQAARDPDPRVARAAVEAALAVAEEAGQSRGILPLLVEAVHAQDPHVRAIALHGLGRFGDVTVFPLLLDAYAAAADDPENAARLAAIDAVQLLRGRGLPAPERAFFARFSAAEDYLVRRRAIERFGEIARERWGDERPIETGVVEDVYADYVARWLVPVDRIERRPRVLLETEAGPVAVELFTDLAPLTAANFLRLAAIGYFDGQEIAAVQPNQLLEAGHPHGDTRAGTGYSLRDEQSRLSVEAGTLAMVRSETDSAAGGFFVAYTAQPALDGTHTAFGTVLAGAEVLERLLPGDRIISVRLIPREE